MAKIKVKAKSRDGIITVRVLIKHPMESGNRKVKGKIVPANHITHLVVTKNNNIAVDANIGGSVSENPFFQFKVPGNKGDEINVRYQDTLGKTLAANKISK